MGAPWENYQNTTQSTQAPWEKYANPKVPQENEGFGEYNARQFGNELGDIGDYGDKVVNSIGQGISSLSDLGNSSTWTGDNDPNKYGPALQNDVVQGNVWQGIKDAAGRVNEGFQASPPGKLLAGVGGILGAPVAPLVQEGEQKLTNLGVPQEFTQLAMNASPLLGIGAEEKPSVSEAPVSKAYQSTANTLVNSGMAPDAIMDAAKGLKDQSPALTLPEATGNATLLSKQRVLGEQGNQAGQNFQDFNQNRLQNDLPIAKQDIVQNAGEGNVSTLTDAGNVLQNAAKSIIGDAIKQRTDAVKPLYNSIKAKALSDDDFMSLRTDPTIENEFQKVIGNDSLMERQNKFTPQIPEELKGLSPDAQAQAMGALGSPKLIKSTEGGLSPNSIGALDQVKKNISSQLQTLLERDPGNAMVPKLQIARTKINETLGQTDPVYKTANDDYAAASPEIAEMKNGPLGRLSLAQNGENAARTFMNMTREQKQQVIPQLTAKNPAAIPQIASAILKEATDKTSDKGLHAYINALSKDQTVRDSMQAILSPKAYEGQKALVDTLQKIQKGQPTNSTTQSKFATIGGINSEGVQGFDLNKIPLSKHGVISGALNKAQQTINSIVQKLQEKHQTELMKVFTDPDLAQLGQALENIKDPQAKASTTMGWLAKKLGVAATAGALLAPVSAAQQAQESLNPPTITQAGPEQKMDYTTTQLFNTSLGDKISGAFAKAESNNNPNAKNPNSSASGLMQFTNRTWADMVSKYGKETGIKMGDKADPKAQQVMATLYAKDNIKELQKLTGKQPGIPELYAAHVLGAHGAAKLLNANPSQEAIMLYPRSVFDANRSIFFTGKIPNTVAQVREILADKVKA